MHIRFLIGVVLVFALVIGSLPPPRADVRSLVGALLPPTAQAQSKIYDLIDRLRGKAMPEGIVKTNGRLEATLVDVSAKYPGRLVDVTVKEGSNVTVGQVVGRIESPEHEAQLMSALGNVERAKKVLTAAEADILSRRSAADFARSDFLRGQELIKSGTITRQTFEERKRNYETAEAAAKAAIARRDEAQSSIKTAEAEVNRIQSILQDMVLISPRNGRVQYQFARSGEVVPAGGRVLTILDLKDVYMTIFLPAETAAKLELGGEARIILDAVPQYVIPASVSFVATEAQFTPKTVETAEERAKLMFRVKLNVDPQVLKKYYRRVKTGVRGLGIVRTDSARAWPANLQVRLPK
jgi:HlyD family secretion protein